MRLKILVALAVMAGLVGVAIPSGEAMAVTCPPGTLRGDGEGDKTANSIAECNISAEHSNENLMKTVNDIINVVLGVLGVVAVGVIIVGAISFITSQGDSAKVTKGRNTILYGVVGLVVALLAFAIVNFVLKGISSGSGSSPTTPVEDKDDGED